MFATDDYEKNLLWKGDADLLKATAESKRFGKILVSGYVNEVESDCEYAVSAITFEFLKKNYFISYRGNGQFSCRLAGGLQYVLHISVAVTEKGS